MRCFFRIRPAKQGIIAERKRIALRINQGVVGITTWAVDRGDGVAAQAGDAGLCSGVVIRVVVCIAELAGEQRQQVVAAGTQVAGLYIAVALQQCLASFFDTEAVGRVVEGAQAMHARLGLVQDISVAFTADVIGSEVFGGDERFAPGQRGRE